MKKITDFKIGDHAELIKTINMTDVQNFAKLTGDDNLIHMDEDFAAKTVFKQPIAHGMLGASFISTLIGKKIPGDGAVWVSQSLDFIIPIKLNDTIRVDAEIIDIEEKNSLLHLKLEIYNQYNQKVTTGKAKVKIVDFEVEEQYIETTEPQKVVLILGATGGIGEATSSILAKEGFEIIIHYNSNVEAAIKLQTSIKDTGKKSIIVRCNILNPEDIKQMTYEIRRHYNKIHYIVNCTSLQIPSVKFEDIRWSDIQAHLDLNIQGTFNIMKEFLSDMKHDRFGKIVFISSFATEVPNSGWIPYITAKSALNGFVKALATETGPFNVNINLVSPGMTETELISNIPVSARIMTKAKAPLKRLAKPEDVAHAIAFLLSDKSNYLTGETLRINGGQIMI